MRISFISALLLISLPAFAAREGIATEALLTETSESHMRIELGWGGAKTLHDQLKLNENSDIQVRLLSSRYEDARPYALLELNPEGTPVRAEVADAEFARMLRDPANPIRLQSVVCGSTPSEPALLIQLKGEAAEKMYAFLQAQGERSEGAFGHPTYTGTHIKCFKKRVARMTRSGPSPYRPLVTLCDLNLTLDGKLLPTSDERQ
jgi:hypothetical protein